MADYSKEYVEKYLNGVPYDFSIIEEFNNIEEGGYYIDYICEGYGFIGISKENGICKLIFHNDDGGYKLIPFEELDDYYNKFLNKL